MASHQPSPPSSPLTTSTPLSDLLIKHKDGALTRSIDTWRTGILISLNPQTASARDAPKPFSNARRIPPSTAGLMDLDPDDVFRDDEDDPENDPLQVFFPTSVKELVVFLVDASPKMFNITCPGEDQENATHFHVAVSYISQSIKVQIINRPYDEIAICFCNTAAFERKAVNLMTSPLG
ncbi:hypothetical protein E3N88_41297 [Mikania micrantha]|uniref:Ku70/Ku80 N-terminal alpha/beta domain-containing protein n=1 Tax=Mikania micrantha TaxID=192012 RepID=A0A5N6LQ05_9ASTR|nr:hypothetical protein E3N88_41297 [Mikania micrantha]